MKNMRFYIVFLVILCISVVLLGLSYSMPSGVTNYKIEELNSNEMRVVYANTNRLYIVNQNETDIGITNLTNEEKNYVIKVLKEKGESIEEVYCSVNNGQEVKIVDSDEEQEVYRGVIKPEGSNGDYVLNHIKINSRNQENAVFVISVAYVDDVLEEDVVDASE